jgi:hypothetical protein
MLFFYYIMPLLIEDSGAGLDVDLWVTEGYWPLEPVPQCLHSSQLVPSSHAVFPLCPG